MAQESSRLERSGEESSYEEPADRSNESERIQADIEETRSDMGETIDAIQDRLSFSNLSEKVSEQVSNAIDTAKDTAYDATVGKAVNFMKETGNGIMDTSAARTVRENPLPFALIGLGSALLIYKGFTRSDSRSRYSKYRTREYWRRQESREMEGSQRLAGTAEKVAEKADQAYEKVTNAATTTLSRTSDAASKVYERVGEFGSTAQETYDRYLDERPLAVAAAAAAVGAAIGFALPSTSYEGRIMGEASENIRSKAEETASGLVDKAKDAVNDATQTGTNQY